MQKLVCIMTFNQVHETGVARSLLDANGIETFLKNEHLVNTVSLYSVALGGIELQVRAEDADEARKILIENDLISKPESTNESFLLKLDKQLSKIPFLDSLQPVYRLMSLAAVFCTVMAVSLLFALRPRLSTALFDSNWCLKQVEHNKIKTEIRTYGNYTDAINCESSLVFLPKNKIVFHGFEATDINALWDLSGNVLTIYSADTLGYLYNGHYILDLNQDQSELNLSGPSLKMLFKRT